MPAPDAPLLLRSGLLDGVSVVVAGAGSPVAERCAALGAAVHPLDADLLDEEALGAFVQALPTTAVLVCDTAPALRSGTGDGAALADAVAGAFNATRAVMTAKLEPSGGGLVLLIAPRPQDGALAASAGAALENLARTTSVEWARLSVRVVAVRPRDTTSDAALADLVAYLASPAGAYFSGCVLELGYSASS
jgi:NAD(P)-dependent dehydrogenase (short-subunit alcohol dehydrogenase family)